MRSWSLIVVGVAALALTSCKQMLDAGRPPPPRNPPAARGESCVGQGDSCQAGLECVHFSPAIGDDAATCEIPCGSGCPDGMTCGQRTDRVFGTGPDNVCI